MATWTALTTAAGRDAAEALALSCEGLTPEPSGTGVFEIEDGSGLWEVGAYFTDPPDQIALSLLAAANVIANGLAGRVDCVVSEGFAHPLLADAAPYGLIFANILKQPLIDLAPQMAANLEPGGRAILSGILTTQAEPVAAAYAVAGAPVECREDLGDWTTLVVRKG